MTTQVLAVISILAGLVALAGVIGTLRGVAKSASQEAQLKRVREDRDDYLSRLNFIEPRHAALVEQNEMLRTLNDPSQRLNDLGELIEENTDALRGQINQVLERQGAMLRAIDGQVHARPDNGDQR